VGATAKEIAVKSTLSSRTVDDHLQRVVRKGVNWRFALSDATRREGSRHAAFSHEPCRLSRAQRRRGSSLNG
jgi:hypothetical protein